MMRLPRFKYIAPANAVDAAAALADYGPEAKVVAGGTDLYPNMKRRQQTPRVVIGLRDAKDLFGIDGDADGGIAIGPMMSLTAIEQSDAIKDTWPALAVAANSISTPPLRNMGTIGGNICLDTRCNYYDQNYEWRKSIDFCMKKDGGTCWVAPSSPRCWAVSSTDTAPVLCAIGATVTLVAKNGSIAERTIDLPQLFNDDGIEYLTKRPEEVVAKIHLPANPGHAWRTAYHKLRRRDSFDFPVLGVAIAVKLADDGTVADARLFIGGVGSYPYDVSDACQPLIGQRPTPELIAEVAESASHVCRPMDNTDFVQGWRKKMAKVYTTRALDDVLATG